MSLLDAQSLQDLSDAQRTLREALESLKKEVWSRLRPAERKAIEEEFKQADELLERLKSGLVWVALFGKVSVGKSSTINAILEVDLAPVDVLHGTTTRADTYPHKSWILVDVPGTMHDDMHTKIAIDEAGKAHGLLFVIDGEPLQEELRLFSGIHETFPSKPKLVFVNKFDVWELTKTEDEQQRLRHRIASTMGRFVKTPQDIIYGSARRLDPATKKMVRQPIPQLLERMYEDTGDLGVMMSLIDPLNRATSISEMANKKIMEVRKRVARQIIKAFCVGSASSLLLPGGSILITPGLLVTMVMTIFATMGMKRSSVVEKQIAGDLWKTVITELGLDFAFSAVAEIFFDAATFTGIGAILGISGQIALGGYKMYRTAILGEATIRYIEDGCSWEGKDKHKIILECKDNVERLYGLKSILKANL